MRRTPPRRGRRRRVVALAGAVDELGFDLLLEWIADGPDRPPVSRQELLEWGAERGLR